VAVLRYSQEIGRPVHDVFTVVIDAGAFASWNPTIAESRRLDSGEITNGSTFEWKLRGFGWVRQHLEEFEPDTRVRIVPEMKSLGGGHRFTLTDLGGRTRVDHELEMIPKGMFKLMAPMMSRTGRKNLTATADALQRHLETASPA
jgi:Polyketide cyclase / dehydrase and lipid transport